MTFDRRRSLQMAVIHSLYNETGTVRINSETCTRCGSCVKICPSEALGIDTDRVFVLDDSMFGCIACGHCMMVCPEGSILVTGRGMQPDDLVPLPPQQQKSSSESLEALMLGRRSVRRFKNEEIPPEILDSILKIASTAPMGIPPWDVGCVIVHGREKVKELAVQIIEGYRGLLRMMKPWALALMRPFMKKTTINRFESFIIPLAKSYVKAIDDGKDHLFYGAPAVMIFHRSPYADDVDASIACTYAMLAAESLGVGTTIIGAAAPIIQRNKKLSKKLGIPKTNQAAIALILGYPAVTFRKAIRRRFLSEN
jgi:ferredoxin